jgi:hypothetical protein
MKTSLLCLIAVFTALGDIAVSAQEGTPAPIPVRKRMILGSPTDAPENHLTKTYRVTLTITGLGEKKHECSLLTSIKQIKANLLLGETGAGVAPRPVGGSAPGARVELNGNLDELEDGKVRLFYVVGASIPIANTVRTDDKGSTTASYSFTEENTTSALVFTLGKSYEVLKVGDRTYSLKIAIEDGDAKP